MRRNAARLFDRDNGITILPFHIQPFHEADFDLSLNDVIIGGTKLGEGAYGVVYSACHGEDIVAAKFQKLPEDLVAQKNLIAELSILKCISHPNLVKFIGAAKVVPPFTESMPFKGTGVLVIMERMALGDLHSVLSRYYQDPAFSWKLRIRMAKQMAAGLACLHSHGIIHRDIKTKNVLLDAYWTAKLCDYGLAISAEANERYQFVAGTKEFMAPELQLGEDYSVQADIFSLGMVFAQLITNRVPGEDGFLERQARELFAIDESQLRSHFPAECPESFATLCVMCCSHEPDNRPTAQEVVDWLDDLYNELPGDCTMPDVDYLKLFNTPAGRLAAKAARRLRDLAKRKTFGGDDFHHDYRIVREYKRNLRNDRIRKKTLANDFSVPEIDQQLEEELDIEAQSSGQTSSESNDTENNRSAVDLGGMTTPIKRDTPSALSPNTTSDSLRTPNSVLRSRRNAGTRSSMPTAPLREAFEQLKTTEREATRYNDFDSVGRVAAHERRHSTGDTRFVINFNSVFCEEDLSDKPIVGAPFEKLLMVKTFSGMYDHSPPTTAVLKEPIYADSPRARRLLSEDNPALLEEINPSPLQQSVSQPNVSRPGSNNSNMAVRLFGTASAATQSPSTTAESRKVAAVSDSEPALRLLSAGTVSKMSMAEVEEWGQFLTKQGQVLLQNSVRLLEHTKAHTRHDDNESETANKQTEMIMMLRQARSLLENSISCLQCASEHNPLPPAVLSSPGSDYLIRGDYFSDTASTISSISETHSENPMSSARKTPPRKTIDTASYAKETEASGHRRAASPHRGLKVDTPKAASANPLTPRSVTPTNKRHSLKKQRSKRSSRRS